MLEKEKVRLLADPNAAQKKLDALAPSRKPASAKTRPAPAGRGMLAA